MSSPLPAEPLAVVTDPERVCLHPALMQDAWFRLLESRGQRISRDRLARLRPQHLIAAAPPADGGAGIVAFIDATRARIPARVQAHIARRNGGAA